MIFEPIPMQRVWGGRLLESRFHRTLPDRYAPYGESWELVDRPEAQSRVVHGPEKYHGLSLHALWTQHRHDVFGDRLPDSSRFPILVKILDAKEDLSIQVHPPAELAAEGYGEPKTEMWYIAEAEPGARLIVGLKSGTDRESFAAAIERGDVSSQVHEVPVKKGDHIFIPSGRIHAIGGGILIYEIQQNSDTTFRVFDWNRYGLDGKLRELHVQESLASIDFSDVEPALDKADGCRLAQSEYFTVERHCLKKGESIGAVSPDRFSLLHVIEGEVSDGKERTWSSGTTMLLTPGERGVVAHQDSLILRTFF